MLTLRPAQSDSFYPDGPVDEAAAAFIAGLALNCRILVAVSGGSDSMGLLVALCEAAGRLGRVDIRISAATVDHALRAQSAGEAAAVGRFCARIGCDHETLVWSGDKPKSGLMAAARDARYELLAAHAVAIGADVIAIGHTLNDQAETFSMRTARNAVLPVTGMAEETLVMGRVWAARPFLAVGRNDIRAMLSARNIPWIDDPSNMDMHYERVRVRHAVAGAVGSLSGAARSAGMRRAALSEGAAALFAHAGKVHGAAVAALDAAALREAPEEALYLLNALVPVIGGETHGPGGGALAAILDFAGREHGARMTAGRCLFERHRQSLFIQRERRGLGRVTVAAKCSALWDGRWRAENSSGGEAVIGPAGLEALPQAAFGALPPRLANLASATAPYGAAVFRRILAPYDRFLPGFDLRLANGLAEAFGVLPFPERAYFQ